MASSDASSRSSIIPQHTEQVITDLDTKRTSISNKLFLETSTPTSASPYPSPSSAFYPPPIPASHEFANKLASNKRYRGLNHAALNNATSNSPITAIASGTAKGELNADGKGNASKVNGSVSPNSTLSPTSSLALDSGIVMDQRRASDAFLSQNSSASPAGRGGRSLSDAPRPSNSSDLGTSKPSDGTKEVSPSTGGLKQEEEALPTERNQKDTKSGESAGVSTKQEPAEHSEDQKPSTSAQAISKDDPPSAMNDQATTTGLLTPSAPSFSTTSADLTQTITVTPELLSDSTPNKRNSLASSLHSSRPAPPSPAPSRRGSLVRRGSSTRRSTYSNTSSRDANSSRGEIVVDDIKSSRRQSRLSMSFNPLSMTEEEGRARSQEASQSEEKEILPSLPKPIIVRDFAYPEDDERFSRLPLELLPLDEREKRLQGQAHDRSTSYDDDEVWDDEDEDGNWDHRWRYEDAELTPLAQMTHSTGGDYDGSHYTYTESGAPDLLSPDLPLQPGIYRALYPFEAEGTAEMSLDEGQLVKVVGRGGGVGWAVVERGWRMTIEDLGDLKTTDQDIDGSNGALALAGQALVPEGYLEPYRLDSS